MKSKAPIYFLLFAMVALFLGMFFGISASFQYLIPEFLKENIPFSKLRPFHVTSVISWIVLCATGSIYFFLTYVEKFKFFSPFLAKLHFIIFLLTGVAIYFSFAFDYTARREYFAFEPILMGSNWLGWVLFDIDDVTRLYEDVKGWAAYYWVWVRGHVFMCYHLMEAQFGLFDFFRLDFIKEFYVQWKSTGADARSWNV